MKVHPWLRQYKTVKMTLNIFEVIFSVTWVCWDILFYFFLSRFSDPSALWCHGPWTIARFWSVQLELTWLSSHPVNGII